MLWFSTTGLLLIVSSWLMNDITRQQPRPFSGEITTCPAIRPSIEYLTEGLHRP